MVVLYWEVFIIRGYGGTLILRLVVQFLFAIMVPLPACIPDEAEQDRNWKIRAPPRVPLGFMVLARQRTEGIVVVKQLWIKVP